MNGIIALMKRTLEKSLVLSTLYLHPSMHMAICPSMHKYVLARPLICQVRDPGLPSKQNCEKEICFIYVPQSIWQFVMAV